MSKIEHKITISCTPEIAYSVSQDYSVRYHWDSFPESIKMLDGLEQAVVGAKVLVVAKSGIKMAVEFVQLSPPHIAAIKMVEGPFFIKSFAGSWLFKALPNGATKATFKYTIKAKSWAIPLVTNRLLNRYFGNKVQARLLGLARYCESISAHKSEGM